MSKLRQLISTLSNQIQNNDQKLSSIKYPNKLLTALKKLNGIVGMEDVKNSIADQTTFLIMSAQNDGKKKYMLNTVFYGPPGVGKTKVGIILADIWYGLGFIENKTTVYGKMSNYEWDNMTLIILSLYIIYGIQILAYIYNKIGLLYFSIILGGILLLALLFYWYWQKEFYSDTVKVVEDTEIIKIVSRKDFVAEYVGQTAIKTNRLLENYRGKVIFVDEAYSLLNDSRDPFGLEALTALNKFMSENPDEIIVIFAGYKDKMQNGIFREQPGLPRRCMWHFECTGYSGTELYKIFKSQLALDNWSLHKSDTRDIQTLIEQYAYLFPAYGGDTERLCFFAKLESTNEAFHKNNSIDKKLRTSQVKRGLKLLSNNNIQKDNYENPTNENNKSLDNLSPQEMTQLLSLLQHFNNSNKSEHSGNNYKPPLYGDE